MNLVDPFKYTVALAIVLLMQLISPGSALAVNIQELSTPSGIKAYLVENYTSPLITISFSFPGGSTQDPEGKEGVSRLLAAMLDEGAGSMSGLEFQAKAEKFGMELGFSTGRDYFSGSMQTLAQTADEAFELLRLAVNEPRFDTQPLERMRQGILLNLRRSKTSPQSIASIALRSALFKNHPYARPNNGKIESVEKLSRDDLVEIYRKFFVREGLVIGVVGAIDPARLSGIIDRVFSALPQSSNLRTITEAKLEFGETIRKDMDIPQSVVSFALPGVKRSHPDFFAAYLANHILGGGSFSSRLYEEVREKRGLAYSVYSHIATYSHAAFTIVGSATSNKRVGKAIEVIRGELKKMATIGPSEKELEAAKKYVIGSYAIRNLDTSISVAGVLVAIQQTGLGIDYIDRREALINAVTLADVKRVAAKLLTRQPTLIVVGPKNS